MKRYLLKDYIDILKKENLVEDVCLCDSILNTSIEKLEHNSKEVANNTLYICKGLNYKPEYLNEAIVRGATAYISEPENVTDPDFPHIVVNDTICQILQLFLQLILMMVKNVKNH